MAKIVWSQRSLQRLKQIFEFYTNQFDEEAATAVMKTIEAAVSHLENFPEMGTPEPVTKAAGFGDFRFVLAKHHKVVYYFDKPNGLILIATVFDSRQHPDTLIQDMK